MAAPMAQRPLKILKSTARGAAARRADLADGVVAAAAFGDAERTTVDAVATAACFPLRRLSLLRLLLRAS